MIVIRDYDLESGAPTAVELGLPDNEIVLGDTLPDLKEQDIVCYLTALKNGGKAYQSELITNNPGVKRWVIILFSSDRDAIAMYRERLEKTGQNIRCLTYDPEHANELAKLLGRMGTPAENRCLIYSCRMQPCLDEFARYMEELLPDWTFSVAAGEPDRFRDSWDQLIIAGTCPEDFQLALPSFLVQVPMFILLRAEESIQLALHPSAILNDLSRRLESSFRWNRARIRSSFFVTSVLYESWYRRYRDRPENVAALLHDTQLVIWDQYGLPVPHKQCTAKSVLRFLGSFTGCADLASRIRENQKG